MLQVQPAWGLQRRLLRVRQALLQPLLMLLLPWPLAQPAWRQVQPAWPMALRPALPWQQMLLQRAQAAWVQPQLQRSLPVGWQAPLAWAPLLPRAWRRRRHRRAGLG